jgi:hypothetical protein
MYITYSFTPDNTKNEANAYRKYKSFQTFNVHNTIIYNNFVKKKK